MDVWDKLAYKLKRRQLVIESINMRKVGLSIEPLLL